MNYFDKWKIKVIKLQQQKSLLSKIIKNKGFNTKLFNFNKLLIKNLGNKAI